MQPFSHSGDDNSDANTSFYSCNEEMNSACQAKDPLWLVVARHPDQVGRTTPRITRHARVSGTSLTPRRVSSEPKRHVSSISFKRSNTLKNFDSLLSPKNGEFMSYPKKSPMDQTLTHVTRLSALEKLIKKEKKTTHPIRKQQIHKNSNLLSFLEQALERCRKADHSPNMNERKAGSSVDIATRLCSLDSAPSQRYVSKSKVKMKNTKGKPLFIQETEENRSHFCKPLKCHSPKKVDQGDQKKLTQKSASPLKSKSSKKHTRCKKERTATVLNHDTFCENKKERKKKGVQPTASRCRVVVKTAIASDKYKDMKKKKQQYYKKAIICEENIPNLTRHKLPVTGNTKNWRINQLIQAMKVETVEPDFFAKCPSSNGARSSQPCNLDTSVRTPQNAITQSITEDDTQAKTLCAKSKSTSTLRASRLSQQGWFMTPRQTEMLLQLHTGLTPHTQLDPCPNSYEVKKMKYKKHELKPLETSGYQSDKSLLDSVSRSDYATDILQTLEPCRSLQTHRLMERHRKKLQTLTKKSKRSQRSKSCKDEKPLTCDTKPTHQVTFHTYTSEELRNALEKDELRTRYEKKKDLRAALEWVAQRSHCEIERQEAKDELYAWEDSETLDDYDYTMNNSDPDRTPRPTFYESE